MRRLWWTSVLVSCLSCGAQAGPRPRAAEDMAPEEPAPDPEPERSWAVTFGQDGDVQVDDISIAPNGAVVVSGRVRGVADFDPGEAVAIREGGERVGFVSRLSATGELRWVRSYPGTYLARVATVPGATYVGVARAVEAGGEGGCAEAGAPSHVLRLDEEGEEVWARAFCGTEGVPTLAPAPEGGVFVVGSSFGSVDFDLGPGTDLRQSAGGAEIVLAALGSEGTLRWGGLVSGPGYLDEALGMAVADDGSLVVVGRFMSTVDFDPGPGTVELTAQGEDSDGFVVRYGPDGSVAWARRIGGEGLDGTAGVAVLQGGDLAVLGYGQERIDLDPGTGTDERDLGRDISSGYLVSLDGSGSYRWGRTAAFGSWMDARLVPLYDDFLFANDFHGTVDGDPGPGEVLISAPGDGQGAILLRIKANGDYVRGVVAASFNVDSFVVATDGRGRMVVAGSFSGAGRVGAHELRAGGEDAAFVASFPPGEGPI